MQIEFTIDAGALFVLDAVRVPRSARAGTRVAVALAEDGVISQEDAVMRVPPHTLIDLLHRQVDETSPRDVFASGIAASPGAATGRIVFSQGRRRRPPPARSPAFSSAARPGPRTFAGCTASVGVLTERAA